MPSLRASGVSFAHSDAAPIFEDATFHLESGWTGLVGANGAGKTTLLRLIAGTLAPTSGGIAFDPEWALVHLCPQIIDEPGPEIAALAAESDRHAKLLAQLRLEPSELGRWPTLSPGERKRWQIGGALAAAPDVLLLDEPTNHLDAEGRSWLVGALRRFRGVGVVVSHDRTLLDDLCDSTLRVQLGAVRHWPGAYGAARREWERELAERQDARQRAQDAQRRQERMLHEKRQELQATTAQRSAGRRMKDRNDSDARTLLANFRVERAQGQLGRRVGAIRGSVEKAAAAAESIEVEKTLGRGIFMGFERCPKPWILQDGPLVLGREDRIRIVGPNGSGKTTLLRRLLGGAHVPRERLLYLPQDLPEEEGARALERIRGLEPEEKGRLLSLVAALGVDPQRLLASANPSPGEARKLLLATGLAGHAWALVLDEPTNHLDLPSIERLQEALQGYPGALLLVTHDDRLAESVGLTATWGADGTLSS